MAPAEGLGAEAWDGRVEGVEGGVLAWVGLASGCGAAGVQCSCRDAPSNMVAASSPLPVFMKNCFSVPSGSVAVIFDVEADDMPPPPADETLAAEGSTPMACATAASSFMVDTRSVLRLRRGRSMRRWSVGAS